MRITFQKVQIRARKRTTCSVCSKRLDRTKTFYQTINPFNKNKDGTIKSERQILDELSVEADAWRKDPEVCQQCEGGA